MTLMQSLRTLNWLGGGRFRPAETIRTGHDEVVQSRLEAEALFLAGKAPEPAREQAVSARDTIVLPSYPPYF